MTTYEHPNTIVVSNTTPTDNPLEDLDTIAFEESEQADKPILEIPRLYWFNGLPATTDEEEATSAVGLHIKAGIDPALDETLQSMIRDEETKKRMGIQRYLVQHKKPAKDGSTAPKPYWRLRTCSLYVVAQRLQSTLEMGRTNDRFGMAYNWGTICDDTGKPEVYKDGKNEGKEKHGTTLKMRVVVQELYQRGYCDWFPFTLSGLGTDELLKAFNEQYRVLEHYSDLRRAQSKNAVAPFYLFSITVLPGRAKLVGPNLEGTIYPVMTQVPATIDTEYLKAHVAPKTLIEQMRGGLLTETIIWSMDESVKIKHGRGEQLALSAGSAPLQINSSAHASEHEQDPFVQQPQLTWITRVYCGNDERKLGDICGYFGVPSTDQLRMSHFRQLVAKVQPAQNGQH